MDFVLIIGDLWVNSALFGPIITLILIAIGRWLGSLIGKGLVGNTSVPSVPSISPQTCAEAKELKAAHQRRLDALTEIVQQLKERETTSRWIWIGFTAATAALTFAAAFVWGTNPILNTAVLISATATAAAWGAWDEIKKARETVEAVRNEADTARKVIDALVVKLCGP